MKKKKDKGHEGIEVILLDAEQSKELYDALYSPEGRARHEKWKAEQKAKKDKGK